jgi:DUF917 family protein
VRGCTILGTGGGGSPEWGLERLVEALKDDLIVGWIDPSEVPDDAWTATAFGMGSIAPVSAETEAETARMGLVETVERSRTVETAIRELEAYTGKKVKALVPVELGGSNTPGPLVSGLRLGIPVVDGDYAGRAIPEGVQTTPYLFGKASWPLSSVDRWGSVCIIKDVQNTALEERIGKMLAVAAYGVCAMAGTLLSGREMKDIVVPGTLTRCLELGRVIRLARDSGGDPVMAAVEFLQGWLLFKGKVTRKDWEDKGGYMYGTTHLQGTDEFEGHVFKVWFKNENHVVWRDDDPLVTSPDLICLVDVETAEPKTNTLLAPGDRMAAIGVKGLDAFRTPRGLKVLGPKHFGFDMDYVPIEKAL